MELNQGNLTLDKRPAVPRKRSAPLGKTSVSTVVIFSDGSFGTLFSGWFYYLH